MSARRPRYVGFTLVEVLVALLLVALGAAAVLSALSNGARANLRLEDRSYAEWVALNVLAEARLEQAAPTLGDTSGVVIFANRSWNWRRSVTRTSVPEVLQIDVRVSLVAPAPSTLTMTGGSMEPDRPELARVTGARLDLPLSAIRSDDLWQAPVADTRP